MEGRGEEGVDGVEKWTALPLPGVVLALSAVHRLLQGVDDADLSPVERGEQLAGVHSKFSKCSTRRRHVRAARRQSRPPD
jgi:hypothetical protein